MTRDESDTQTKWIIGAVSSLLILALTTLAGLDRSRIAGDASTALQIAQRVDAEQRVLRADTSGDLKEIRSQLAEIRQQQAQQTALLEELRRKR